MDRELNELLIKRLIDLNHEGDFWDFKEMWYKNNADLLGDILNFANTVHHKDCYIIIGVRDSDFEVVGVKDGDQNRKNTQNIQDFLKNAKFEGGRVPIVRVSTYQIQGKSIDVISIFDSLQLPFFLTEDYHRGKVIIRSGAIYSRIEDTNTDKNSSTNLGQMEKIWRKRFELDITPAKRLVSALRQPDRWKEQSSGEGEYYYYDNAPEFQIRILNENDNGKSKVMPYSANQSDKEVSYYEMNLMVGGTKIFDFQGVSLDGGRYLTVAPDPLFVEYAHDYFKYYVMVKNSVTYVLYEFLRDKQKSSENARIADDHFAETFAVVNDEFRQQELNDYLQEYINKSFKKLLPAGDTVESLASFLRSYTRSEEISQWAKSILMTNKLTEVATSYVKSL